MTELERVDAWWRAANYLTAAQLYLLDNLTAYVAYDCGACHGLR